MDELKNAPIWVAWLYETRDGKQTKVPYQNSSLHASSTDPSTWNIFSEVQKIPKKDGVGIVFEPTYKVVGIDFDHCVSDGVVDEKIQKFLLLSQSYCEFSPSKSGLHVLFISQERIDLEANKHYFSEDSHVEIYTHGRYFTFTGDEHELSKPIRTISTIDFLNLISSLGYPWKKASKAFSPSPSFSTPSLNLSDSEVLDKMFASKNGFKIRQLFDGDISSANNDLSSADFSLCLHLAFWTQKNYEQIERLWLSSPLAQREKTREREDYRRRTIENAISTTQEVFRSPSLKKHQGDIDYDFILSAGSLNKDPYPELIFPNILRVLRKDPELKGKFRKNDFSHLVESSFSSSGDWLPLTDDVISKTREHISENFSFFRKLSKDMLTDAILRVALDSTVNPPREYFSSLVWDGVPRLNSWLYHSYGTPDDELHQAIGSNWIKGLVKRVMIPGCQFDEVLALESPQGWRKSSSIRALGSPWHVETAHSIDNKDFYLLLAQNIIVEFSEGEIFDRASVKKLKAEITKTEDQVRPPYERGIVKFKRSCVFAVTTNKLELKDDTGNRRWLPVSLSKPADVEWIKNNRDQLFAEAFHRAIIVGESTHEYPKESLEELQASRAEWSDYDEKIIFWYAKLDDFTRDEIGIALHDACRAAYGSEIRITRMEELQIATSLRRSLMLENRNKRIDGAVLKRWFPSDKTRAILKEISPPYSLPSSQFL